MRPLVDVTAALQYLALKRFNPGDVPGTGGFVPPPGEATTAALVSVVDVSKSFGSTHALRGVSLDLRPGEIHALVGENGAGKSTLIKVMTGLYRPDAGHLEVAGEVVELRNPADAQALGIACIYQEPLVFPDLTVSENIFMGSRRGPLVRWRAMHAAGGGDPRPSSRSTSTREPSASQLTVAGQQAVEIAKAMSRDVRVLIMDEPTAALSAHEVQRLFRQVRRLAASGVAILFVSHRLDEVFELSDRITVLRDGQHISTSPVERGHRGVADPRHGRSRAVRLLPPRAPRARRRRARASTASAGRVPSTDVSFEVRAGRGARLRRARRLRSHGGRRGAVRRPPGRCRRRSAATARSSRSARRARRWATASPTSPRIAVGSACRCRSRSRRTSRCPACAGSLTAGASSTAAPSDGPPTSTATACSIRTPSLATPVANLSGGNQQKVMLAKWLDVKPSVLHPRRADAGHRRRRQGRRPRAHRRARPRRRGRRSSSRPTSPRCWR